MQVNLSEYVTNGELFTYYPEKFQYLGVPRDGYAIAIDHIREALNAISNYFGDDSPQFMAVLTLTLTGARIKELDYMNVEGIHNDGNLSWKLGKSQRGNRTVKMPDYYWKCLRKHRNTYNPASSRLLSWSAANTRRKFNSDIRPLLSECWKRTCPKGVSTDGTGMIKEFRYQLKGFRKTFATFTFYKMWEKYGDANVALLMAGKELRHSTHNITARHYIEDGESIYIKNWLKFSYGELFAPITQLKLTDSS